jgi:hypothetical protein
MLNTIDTAKKRTKTDTAPFHTAPIEPITENGAPRDPSGFLRDAGIWTRLLFGVLAKDKDQLTEMVRKLLIDENGKDSDGEAFFHLLNGFEDMAKRTRGIADVFESAHARLLLAVDALARDTSPPGQYRVRRPSRRAKGRAS